MGASEGFKELRVYQLAFKFAMEIFRLSKSFPPEEKYSLTDQIRRSSRSVAANIAEGYRKKQYPRMFVSKIEKESPLVAGYEEVGRMLGGMIAHPERFSR